MADVIALRSLGRAFWYRWLAGVALGVCVLLAATLAVRPDNAWLVAILGSFGVVMVGYSAVELTLGNRILLVGHLVMAAGWGLLAAAGAGDVLDAWLWYGFGLVGIGSLAAIADDHADRFRRTSE